MIYLDHAATTTLSAPALETWLAVSTDTFGNPSSVHHFGRKAKKILRQARQTIATCLATQADRIIFTSGGTEADNLAIKGYAFAHKDKGKHLITTAIEHHAVLDTMQYLEKHHGFEVTYLQPESGTISAKQVQDALRPDTILVSMMYANNETGLLLPIEEVGTMLSDHPAVFHVDAVQGIGKYRIEPEALGIDLLSASAHKFHGPKGVGFLYSRVATLTPLLHGGKQEDWYRAGTENLAAIAAMATALSHQQSNLEQHQSTICQLRQQLLDGLEGMDYYLNQSENHSYTPSILNLGFPDHLNEQLLMQLDLAGIAVSSGSACTAGVVQTSHVLEALYGSHSPRLRESIRISLAEDNLFDDIHTLIRTLKEIIGGKH